MVATTEQLGTLCIWDEILWDLLTSYLYFWCLSFHGVEKCKTLTPNRKSMEPIKWPLQSAVLEKVSWRFQSAALIGLVGLSSKIFLGRFTNLVLKVY